MSKTRDIGRNYGFLVPNITIIYQRINLTQLGSLFLSSYFIEQIA